MGSITLDRQRAIATALGARLDVFLRWDGGELDRLLNARHSAMHELVARRFANLPEWVARPEVSFAIFAERGVVDLLAWHAPTATVMVIELKTEIVDVNELLGTLGRKRRLAREIAADQGWRARRVAVWLVVAEGRTNRRRVEAHRTMLRSALPDSSRRLGVWLRRPVDPPLALLSFMSDVHGSRARSGLATPKRVGRVRAGSGASPGVAKWAAGARAATTGQRKGS